MSGILVRLKNLFKRQDLQALLSEKENAGYEYAKKEFESASEDEQIGVLRKLESQTSVGSAFGESGQLKAFDRGIDNFLIEAQKKYPHYWHPEFGLL